MRIADAWHGHEYIINKQKQITATYSTMLADSRKEVPFLERNTAQVTADR